MVQSVHFWKALHNTMHLSIAIFFMNGLLAHNKKSRVTFGRKSHLMQHLGKDLMIKRRQLPPHLPFIVLLHKEKLTFQRWNCLLNRVKGFNLSRYVDLPASQKWKKVLGEKEAIERPTKR